MNGSRTCLTKQRVHLARRRPRPRRRQRCGRAPTGPWPVVRLPLLISLGLGSFWIAVAQVSVMWALVGVIVANLAPVNKV